ncbi:MAG TPA: DUF309 domain-containing protein [Candidatus Polarisedimenticolaceae bacterium]|nr:DUF309 domain-containing protein [Candidatus Polarisedimenticolaceae bacterium]
MTPERDRDERGRPRFAGPRDRLGRPLPRGRRDQLAGRGDPARDDPTPAVALAEAARLFDAERYFEAHEYFEYLWKHPAVDDGHRSTWRAAAQLAVGLCHGQRGNRRGASRVLRRASHALDRIDQAPPGVDRHALAALARAACERVDRGEPSDGRLPRFPRR